MKNKQNKLNLNSASVKNSSFASSLGEVGLQKIMLFPDKLKSLQSLTPGSYDESYPILVELSLTNACNQKCLWCSDYELRQRSPDNLDRRVLKALFADLAKGGTRGVTIEGGGEPTISPNFNWAVREAKNCGLALGLISNGLDFRPDKEQQKAFEWIRISLDAASPAQYQELKGGDSYQTLLTNLRHLADNKEEATTLGLGYVLTAHNDDLQLLEKLVKHLAELSFDYIHLRPVVDKPQLQSKKDPAEFEVLKKYETENFKVNISALYENKEGGNHNLPCLAHSLSTVIGADGAVWLCGRLNMDDSFPPIGNLNDETFTQIWHGSMRAQQCAQVADARFCRINCPQCRISKYNRLLWELNLLKTKNFI